MPSVVSLNLHTLLTTHPSVQVAPSHPRFPQTLAVVTRGQGSVVRALDMESSGQEWNPKFYHWLPWTLSTSLNCSVGTELFPPQ